MGQQVRPASCELKSFLARALDPFVTETPHARHDRFGQPITAEGEHTNREVLGYPHRPVIYQTAARGSDLMSDTDGEPCLNVAAFLDPRLSVGSHTGIIAKFGSARQFPVLHVQ